MSETNCPKCGSNRIVPDAVLRDQGQGSDGKARMAVDAHPNAILFKGTETVQVKGQLCCQCGHLELKCEGDLEAIWSAWLQARDES